MHRLLTAVALLAATALAVPAATDARGFGANLKKRPANGTLTCATWTGPDALGNPLFYPTGVNSCTWYTISRRFNTSREGTIIPYNRGVLTSASLKVGKKTGRMRLVLLRAVSERPPSGYRSNQACCKQVKQTRPFRPRRNRITKKRLNWRLRGVTSFDPYTGLTTTGYYVLAVSVLTPGTPVPTQDTGRYQSLEGPGSVAFFPALRRGEERTGTGQFGWIVLLRGNVRR